MIKRLTVIISVALAAFAGAAPLRIVVVSDVEAVRNQYGEILKKAGAQVGVTEVPTAAMLEKADAVLLHGRGFKALPDEAGKALSAFAARGGGIVAINGGIAAGDAAWGRSLLGGGWDPAKSGKFSSLMMLYVTPNSSPIVAGASSFDITDDTIYDLDLPEKLTVLGTAFTSKGREGKGGKDGKDGERASIYDIQPQMWTFEGDKHRAAVLLPGADETLAHASMRTFILRSLAWTAKREKMDELVTPADIVDLRYPVGGPMRAAKAIQQFQMQPGFTATVIAEEPLINKPIAIQWDAKGQLWVAETPEYPNGRRPLVSEPWKETGVLEPGQYDRPGRDRICRLVDTNGDGQMDSKVVFYEGLELVTGFQVYGDGVIVVAQPNIVYLADTDGDGKADLEKPLFGGFTPGDTHFVTNNFILAPDGWIYASTGSAAGARDPQTKKDVAKISPGVFRFRPDGSAIEQVASQGGNTFGCEVTSDMEIFHGKATSGQPVQHVVLPEWVIAKAPGFDVRSMNSVNPGRTVARADLPKRAPIMQIDQVGRYSAACSVPVYEGGAWPEEYNGTIFMTEPILDIIHHERMVPKGPSLEGKLVLENKEWLRSTDYWFSPITVTFGPDGAMYVLDFYTPVVTHNDTRGPKHSKSGGSVRPDRDHYFGRIYRIQHDSAPKTPFPDMTKMDGPGLVATFKNANRLIRSTALRLLMEKQVALSTAALPALQTMAAGEKMAAARIQALWALQRFGHLDAPTFAKAASSEDASVRKNAMLIAEAGARELTAEQTKAALADSDERVRLAALRALGASPLSNANAAVLGASLASLNNPWAEVAAAAAASSNPTGLLEGMLASQGTGSSAPLRNVAKSLATSVARSNKAADTTRLLKAAAASKDAPLAVMVVQQLSASPVANPDAALVAATKALLASSNRDLAAAALPLAAGMDGVKDEMAKTSAELAPLAQDASAPLERRVAAVRSLVAARGTNPAILRTMAGWLSDAKPAAFLKELISALAVTGDPVVGEALVNNFASFDTDQRTIAFDAIVGRAEWCALWLDAMDKGKLAANLLDQRGVSRLTAHPDVATATRAKALFGRLAGGSGSSKAKIIADLLPAVNKPGDAAKGKATFTAACMVCHQFQGAGQQFGPSLDGMGSHPASDLLTHIVDPSLVVDDEHRTWNITMKDGTQYSGLIGSENQTRIQLKQPGGAVLDLKPSDVAARKKADNSLMPEGFEALGADALRDLIAYLRSGDTKK